MTRRRAHAIAAFLNPASPYPPMRNPTKPGRDQTRFSAMVWLIIVLDLAIIASVAWLTFAS